MDVSNGVCLYTFYMRIDVEKCDYFCGCLYVCIYLFLRGLVYVRSLPFMHVCHVCV